MHFIRVSGRLRQFCGENVPTLGQPDAIVEATDGLSDIDGHIGAARLSFLQGWMDQYVA